MIICLSFFAQTSDGSGRALWVPAPTSVQFFFQFHAVFREKMAKVIGLHPTFWVDAHPREIFEWPLETLNISEQFRVKKIYIQLPVPCHTQECINSAFSHACSVSLKGFTTSTTTISVPASKVPYDVVLTVCFPNVIFLM